MDIERESDAFWSRKCRCGKSFYQPNSFSNHIRSCPRYKNDVGTTLENAKAKYAQKRKSKKGTEAIESWYGDDALDIDQDLVMEDAEQPPPPPEELPPAPVPMGRGMRLRAPPKGYRDFLATSAIPFEIPMFGHAMESPPPESPPPDPVPVTLTAAAERRHTVLDKSLWKASQPNGFGAYKVYWTLESRPHDPDLFLLHSDLREDEDDRLATLFQPSDIPPSSRNPYDPFPNWSSYQIGGWYWSDGGDKSRESFQRLIGILCSEDFSTAEVRDTNWRQVDSALASSEFEDSFGHKETQWAGDGTSWKTSSITVSVPFNSTSLEPGPKLFTVENFRFRPLVPLIQAKLRDPKSSEHFHVLPSELWWQGKDRGDRVRVYGDLYHSDALLEEYRSIQLLPAEEKDDDLPRYVVALMFASDDTMLASFGHAKLWPVYLHFGNNSKYRRGRTSLKLLEEVAYLEFLPDSFDDWYIQESGKKTVGEELMRHVKQELFHAQWRALLDDEFIQAYEHGLVIDCPDGVRRRFYPRIMTYSADYPERVRVVGIRNIGDCPCPRCLVSLDMIPQLGTVNDRLIRTSQKRVDDANRKDNIAKAREHIDNGHYAVGANVIEQLLKPTSLVVAQNTFSDRLSPLGFDLHQMVSPDVLHEVEIGVWKDMFVHLLRLLEAIGVGKTDTLNSRFRQIPSFGRDTIRHFSHNVSGMRQMGASDFEDLLQCSLPAFEGLFPGDHDSRVQDLIFSMAHWHALAKLRMHTDSSLDVLDRWTSILGERSRTFIELTCSCFQTKELKREYDARKRREASKAQPKSGSRKGTRKSLGQAQSGALPNSPESLPSEVLPGGATSSSGTPLDVPLMPDPGAAAVPASVTVPNVPQGQDGRRLRTWNISTPKFHALGDVVPYIKRFGTTDSYSTQWSESYHRLPKARYRRTNKKNVGCQLSQIQTRQTRIKKLHAQVHPSKEELDPSHPWAAPDSGNPQYFMGRSQNQPVNLVHFLRLNAADLATTDFLAQLKGHLFPRIIDALIQEVEADVQRYPDAALLTLKAAAMSQPSEHNLGSVYIHSDTMYRHNVLKVPYTTYDCRQDSDTINLRTTRRDFMCLTARAAPRESASGSNPSESDPDLDHVYGRVMGMFHANVIYDGRGALDYRRRRFDFLWVRWFVPLSTGDQEPWTSHRLDRVKLAPIAHPGSWGFVDPADVLRAAHIIPRFSLGLAYEEKKVLTRKGGKTPVVGGNRVPKPILSKCAQEERDWKEYYVNRFVDRDMVMRFHRGIAVGHSYSRVRSLGKSGKESDQDVPMEVDGFNSPPPDFAGPSYASQGADTSIGAEGFSDQEELSGSDDSGRNDDGGEGSEDFDVAEPDSEEEPDIYL